MGFLKFLKRDKKKEFDKLDLPPEPPSFDEYKDLSEFPEFKEELSDIGSLPKFDFPQEKFPELPDFPEMEEKTNIPPITAPLLPESALEPILPQPETQQQVVEEPQVEPSDTHPKIEKRLFAREKMGLKERTIGKSIYIRVDDFKAALGNINMVRYDLKKSEEVLMKLENIKNSKDKSFDKAKIHLQDLQKKLIFIDKTLFKGE